MISAERLVPLVEDDPADARLIQRAFEKAELGTRITRIPNGDDELAYLAGHQPFDNRNNYSVANSHSSGHQAATAFWI